MSAVKDTSEQANKLEFHFVDMDSFVEVAHNAVVDLYGRKIPAQRTPEWYAARTECITASDIANVLPMSKEICEFYVKEYGLEDSFRYNEKKSCNKYSTMRDFIIKKTDMGAKHNVRGPKHEFPMEAIRHGQLFEPVSQTIYSQMKQDDILEVGLVQHPTIPFIGASPDGIAVKSGTMLEIKCPSKREVSNIPPLWYWMQMQAQMECCNLSVCDFFDCHFVRYMYHDEWRTEADTWMTQNPDALHHEYGIIIQEPAFVGEPEYLHAPVSVRTPDEFEAWAALLEADDPERVRIYYGLDKYYLTSVRKQDNWMEVVLPSLQSAWDLVTYYRASENAEKYREFLTKKPTRASSSSGTKSTSKAKTKVDDGIMTIVTNEQLGTCDMIPCFC